MTVTIAPINLNHSNNSADFIYKIEENENHESRYWGVFLNDSYISYTPSKEKALQTKEWMEKWLKH